MPNGEPWLRAAFAAWRLGAAVIPLPLPVAFAGAEAYLKHLRRIADIAELDAVLVDSLLPGVLTKAVERGLPGHTFINVDEPLASHRLPAIVRQPGDEAVIQFTSGSTSAPKGVVLSHRNVLAGLEAIVAAIGLTPADEGGLWIPLFHDMGLFSTLAGLSAGIPMHLWQPVDFIKRPMRWLKSFADLRLTALTAPNFFYELLVKAAAEGTPTDLDLSAWRFAGNGAEPIHASTMAEFSSVFGQFGFRSEAMTPMYGMAEATLMVTGTRGRPARTTLVDRDQLVAGQRAGEAAGPGPAVREVVSCGRPVSNISVRVSSTCGSDMSADRVVGEVQLRGAAVTSGYLGLGTAEQPFTTDGWLRTGDLGFLDDGELYVVGRAKDMIVVRGRNYYAEDVEDLARSVPGGGLRRCAAFCSGEDGEEHIVVLWEAQRVARAIPEVSAAIKSHLTAQLGLERVEVVAVPSATIPITTSGKVKRAEARNLLASLNGQVTGR
jgi:acyl-CoA synthetase (AMP-forming)/AMP-acid ligase II